ncbi:hypothetical protein OAB85_04175 [Pseudomonadales bacterium]|nr:hypothetical protein [Pseudomonadales bacterium]
MFKAERIVGSFSTDDAENKGMEGYGAAAICDTRNLNMVEEVHNTMDQ